MDFDITAYTSTEYIAFSIGVILTMVIISKMMRFRRKWLPSSTTLMIIAGNYDFRLINMIKDMF